MRVELSFREAEAAMVEAQKHAQDLGFYLIPVDTVTGHPEKPANTPKIHFETRSGVYLGKHGSVQRPSSSSGLRRSGSSGTSGRGG
eukprot:CAMPEP_0174726928 /NCGR_PEP_ID=MMETSP1094-20130205/48719_1 /TAXON_ID=156173 /ORGANISM="Chrysochromulina brevifilum, Strain UTEX LB 985" /LENGTH=85 /DNA_ID=CAMNT_0015928561 /DNA_START=35 /DNA_END=289 /DNA_ORIENTATION=+